MKNDLLFIDPQTETEKIVSFLKDLKEKQSFDKVVIGLSEGIDSTTTAYLLARALGSSNIIALHMPYFETDATQFHELVNILKIPQSNQHIVYIKNPVDSFKQLLNIKDNEHIRLGNIMARSRMITLFDFAKKEHALVCGTENRSEHLLGYFTRYGDGASDIEPILHLYKTQVKQLAHFLEVPNKFITKVPSAGLWPGQSDEKEFGFSYADADQVLSLYYDQHFSLEKIKEQGYNHAESIIKTSKSVEFKHSVPYTLPTTTSTTRKPSSGESSSR